MELEQRQDRQHSLVMRLWMHIQALIDWLLGFIRQDHKAMESYLICGIGVWVTVFFLNPRLFALSPLIYEEMAKKGTPASWAWRAVFLIALWLYGAVSKLPPARYVSQIFVIGWYFFLFALFASAGVVSFGAGIHLLGFLYSIWVLWRYAGRKQDAP